MTLKRSSRSLFAALDLDPSMPWAIDEALLGPLNESLRGGLPDLSDETVRQALAAIEAASGDAASRHSSEGGPVGVVRIRGIIQPRPTFFSLMFGGGGGGLVGLRRELQALVDNEAISTIVLDIDSPGGSVALVAETADFIAEVAAVKTVIAVSNVGMASAAYWLGSQATELVVTPSGRVGSIGTVLCHYDFSQANEKQGVVRTYIHAGKYKVEGNADEPLDGEAEAELQRGVDDYQALFTAAVARGRGVSEATVDEEFGQGRMFTAQRAVDAGLADRVASLDEVLAELADRPEDVPDVDPEDEDGEFDARAVAASVPRSTARLMESRARSGHSYRACMEPIEVRAAVGAAEGPATEPVMTGHFAVTDRWTEIDSRHEGNFLERFAKGSLSKTLVERKDKIQVLYFHGRDLMIGSKPLGRPESLREEGPGAFYRVPLLAADYVRQLVPALEEGLLGASHRFGIVRADWVHRPGKSAHNPKGLPECTVLEARVAEFGPCPFGQYEGATAGLRSFSITDAVRAGNADLIPELLAASVASLPVFDGGIHAPSQRAAAGSHADTAPDERRVEIAGPRPVSFYGSQEQKERPSWIA